MAKHPYIFLCDDDIEMPPDYLQKIATYLLENEDAGIVTGCFLQKNKDGEWEYQYRNSSFFKCLWHFIFQLSCWGDFSLVKTNFITKPVLKLIEMWYCKRGNTYTKAGWPLLTHLTNPVTRTAVYTLGAAVVKKDWLLASPYEEKLVPNGIGDNYGVTLNIPHQLPVHILHDTHVWHHHAPENRLKSLVAYHYRIYALHYFMVNSTRFNRFNILFLYWSLLGNFIYQLLSLQPKLAATSFGILVILACGQNPYLKENTP